jgi:hypothetical protein
MPCNQVRDRFPSPAVTTGLAFTLLGDRLTKAEDILQVLFPLARKAPVFIDLASTLKASSGATLAQHQRNELCLAHLKLRIP